MELLMSRRKLANNNNFLPVGIDGDRRGFFGDVGPTLAFTYKVNMRFIDIKFFC